MVGEWQTYMLKQKLLDLNSEPGMLVTEIESTGRNRVSATILRDRASLPIEDWLQEHDISRADLRIIEQAFISIESEIVARKLSQLVANYPSLSFIPASQEVSGILNWRQMQQFNRDFAALPGIGELSIDRSNVRLAEISLQAGDQPAIQRQLFEQLVGEISRVQIEFQVGESNLDEAAINTVVELTKLLESALELGQSLQLSANLIIIGASDTSGATSVNQRLSLQRANAVKTALINQGIEVNRLYSTGIGEINLSSDAVATRRVMFNLMYAETKS
jgi:outer membrane protein OmpA-like peptidoglycan-associated protein